MDFATSSTQPKQDQPMALELKPVHQQVIVITGASSGIGLATAKLAAKKGAAVVLAARSRQILGQITHDISSAGGQAVSVIADVADRQQVQQIADEAISH